MTAFYYVAAEEYLDNGPGGWVPRLFFTEKEAINKCKFQLIACQSRIRITIWKFHDSQIISWWSGQSGDKEFTFHPWNEEKTFERSILRALENES
jgi:hypothetical protein